MGDDPRPFAMSGANLSHRISFFGEVTAVAIDFTDVRQSSVKVQVKKAPAQAGAELEVWMV